MYDITLNEWFRHLAVCDAQNAGRRVTRSATKKKSPAGDRAPAHAGETEEREASTVKQVNYE